MSITDNAKVGIVTKMCWDAEMPTPDEAIAVALFDEAQRLANDIGLREAYHFLAIAVELSKEMPYEGVLRRMQALTLSE